jgi:hypothetical protein
MSAASEKMIRKQFLVSPSFLESLALPTWSTLPGVGRSQINPRFNDAPHTRATYYSDVNEPCLKCWRRNGGRGSSQSKSGMHRSATY